MDAPKFCTGDNQRHRLAQRAIAQFRRAVQPESVLDHPKLPVDGTRSSTASKLEPDRKESDQRHRQDRAKYRFGCSSGTGIATQERPKTSRIFVVEWRWKSGGSPVFLRQKTSIRRRSPCPPAGG